jgi:hypothetical protein
MTHILRRGRNVLVSALTLTAIAGTAIAAPASPQYLLDAEPPSAAAAEAAATPVLRRVVWGGTRSGLPWASGASSGSDDLETWRGRKLDVRTAFLASREGWTELAQVSWLDRWVADGGYTVVGVGLLPETARGQLAQCAAGAFDAWIRKIGVGMVAAGAGNAILRLGWEANRVGGYAWAITSDPGPFKGCYRRWVQVLRSVPGQSFTFDWNMGSRGSLPYHVDRAYPGDAYVDVIGVQYYDRCPPAVTQADWNLRYNAANPDNGSPWGIGRWLAYARSKGKRLSVPEWGIGGPIDACGKPGIDNPFFIRKMHGFFKDNAASIAYEAYFNGNGTPGVPGSHEIAPPNAINPLSWAAYDALWGKP